MKRFILEGTDYVYPRTSNNIIRAFLHAKGVDDDILENYTPFGFSDWQTEVAAIKNFGSSARRRPWSQPSTATRTCRSTRSSATRGSRRPTFRSSPFRSARRSSPASTPRPRSGTSTAWTDSESVNTPENKDFIAKWHAYNHDPKSVTNDPMELDYILFHMWVQAVQQAGRPTSTPCGRR